MSINLSASQKIIHLRSSGGTPAVSELTHSLDIESEEIWPAGPSDPLHVFTFNEEPPGFIFIDSIDQSVTATVVGSAVIVDSGLNLLDNATVDFSEEIVPAGDGSIIMRIQMTSGDVKVLLSDFDGTSGSASGSAILSSGVALYEHKESGATLVGTTSISDSQYHTVIVTKEGLGDLNLYVDTSTAEDTLNSLDTISPPDIPLLGSYTGTTSSGVMFIRELVVFNRILNSLEIQQVLDYY